MVLNGITWLDVTRNIDSNEHDCEPRGGLSASKDTFRACFIIYLTEWDSKTERDDDGRGRDLGTEN